MNKEKGDLYEQYINDYLNNKENSQSFLWSNIPEKHLLQASLIHDLNKHRLNKIKHANDPIKYKNPVRINKYS
jgi:hypothetical protein